MEEISLEQLTEIFKPHWYSYLSLKRKVGQFGNSLAVPSLILDIKLAGAWFRQLLITTSDGIEVLWDLFSAAFIRFYNTSESYGELLESALLRQSVAVGTIIAFVVLMRVINGQYSVWAICYLGYQFLRVVSFFGMVNEPPKQSPPIQPEGTSQFIRASEDADYEDEQEQEEQNW